MTARREVKEAKASGDDGKLTVARQHVQAAKVALGSAGRFGGTMAVWTSTGTRFLIRVMQSGSAP